MADTIRPLSLASEQVARGYTRRFVRNLPPHLDPQDFLSVALIAAWKAEDTFDPTRGATLFTWVRGQVWNALIEQLRREDHLTRGQRSGRNDDELPDHYRLPMWIDMPVGDEGLNTLADILPQAPAVDRDGYTPALRRGEIEAELRRLCPRYQYVVERHYFDAARQIDIARELGVSGSRVQQYLVTARETLRETIQP